MNKVLIVAAHPDDEVLGCGGTIAHHADNGDHVYILLMADGVTSRPYTPDQKLTREEELSQNKEAIDRRRDEAIEAAKIMGVPSEHVHLLNLPDQRLDDLLFLDLVKYIERVKAKVQPDIVYTHYLNDLNLDHHLTGRATITAFRPVPGKPITSVYHFEVPESTQLSQEHKPFRPNHFTDISNTIDRKLQALNAYESEQREYPDLRSAQYIKEHAEMRGADRDDVYSEAFYINHGFMNAYAKEQGISESIR